jgi:hypothetical protein
MWTVISKIDALVRPTPFKPCHEPSLHQLMATLCMVEGDPDCSKTVARVSCEAMYEGEMRNPVVFGDPRVFE